MLIKTHHLTTVLRFIVPSLIGALLFMTPVTYQGEITIPIALAAKWLQHLLADSLTAIVTAIVLFSASVTLLQRLLKMQFIKGNAFFKSLFEVSAIVLLIRMLAAIFIVVSFWTVGPEAIYSADTGALILNGLLPILFSIFIFAGLLLPLLLNFGLLELLGTLLTGVMRPLFNLPGRSAIDCMTSWLGDGSIAVLLTSKQYELRFYTQREAAVIGTTFSAVSITFSLVVISQVGLAHLFVPFYLTVCAAGIIAALIVPKLPPLCWKANRYIDNSAQAADESIPDGHSVFSWAIAQALHKAANSPSFKETFIDALKNVLEMLLTVIPVVMATGTTALLIAQYTPIFEYLGYPFTPMLQWLGIAEAAAASKTMMVGFVDMFIPSLMAASIESDMTRFVIATLSVTQLIYMSEVGALLLGSKIPVNILELFIIFILRTLVLLPVIAGSAHLIF